MSRCKEQRIVAKLASAHRLAFAGSAFVGLVLVDTGLVGTGPGDFESVDTGSDTEVVDTGLAGIGADTVAFDFAAAIATCS